jgi:hypothetical protein
VPAAALTPEMARAAAEQMKSMSPEVRALDGGPGCTSMLRTVAACAAAQDMARMATSMQGAAAGAGSGSSSRPTTLAAPSQGSPGQTPLPLLAAYPADCCPAGGGMPALNAESARMAAQMMSSMSPDQLAVGCCCMHAEALALPHFLRLCWRERRA